MGLLIVVGITTGAARLPTGVALQARRSQFEMRSRELEVTVQPRLSGFEMPSRETGVTVAVYG